MPLAPSVTAVHHDLRTKELVITLTPSGNYVNNGDTVNLTALTNPKHLGDALIGFPGVIDDYEVLQAPAGFSANLVPGATLATWLLEVFETGAALSGPFAQIAAAAYPAGVLAGVFTIRLRGPKGKF